MSAMKLLNVLGPVSATTFADVNAVAGSKYYYLVKPTDGSVEHAPAIEPVVSAK